MESALGTLARGTDASTANTPVNVVGGLSLRKHEQMVMVGAMLFLAGILTHWQTLMFVGVGVVVLGAAYGRSRVDQRAGRQWTPGPYYVILTSVGQNAYELASSLCQALDIPLEHARDLMKSAPCILKAAVSREDADFIQQSLKRHGAVVIVTQVTDTVIHSETHPPAVSSPEPIVRDAVPAPADTRLGSVSIPPYPSPASSPWTPPSLQRPSTLPSQPASPGAIDLVLLTTGPDRMRVSKVLRKELGLDLLEAYYAVEQTPSVIRKNITRSEAENLRRVIEAEGGTVEFRPASNSDGAHDDA